MAGLLERIKGIPNSPLAMASLGLLSMPSRSRQPLNPLEYAMSGMQAGMQNQQNQQQLAQQQQLYAMREAELSAQLAERKEATQRKDQIKAYVEQSSDPNLKNIYNVGGEAAAAKYLADKLKPQGPIKVGGSLLDPNTYAPLYTAPPDPQNVPAGYRLNASGQREIDPEYWAAKKSAAPNAGQPSTVQEWQYFNSLSPPDQTRFLQMKRANPYVNLGGEQTQFDPANPGVALNTEPVTPKPEQMPDFKGQQERAKTIGTEQGKAAANLPTGLAKADEAAALVEALKTHPGMPDVVGAPNVLSLGGRVPGTKGADFRARLEQLSGVQFLQAYETLKGGGAISEAEGTKAQNAIARMQSTQSEKEFVRSADEFLAIIRAGTARLQAQAGNAPAAQPQEFEEMPNPAQLKGKTIEDDSGKRWKSNGLQWVPQ